MSNSIEIYGVANGYVVAQGHVDDDGNELDYLTVSEIVDGPDELGELKAMRSVLYEVIEYFDCFGSKHDKYRLHVEIINQESGEVE